MFYCCEFVVFAYNYEIDEQSKSIYLIYEKYNCATVKYSESGTIQHGDCCPHPASISDNRCSIQSPIEISGYNGIYVTGYYAHISGRAEFDARGSSYLTEVLGL